MSFYSLIFGDTLDNLFTRYAWRFLFLTVGIFFLLDLILSFLNEFEDLSEFYSFNKILLFLAFTSVDAVFDIFPLSAMYGCDFRFRRIDSSKGIRKKIIKNYLCGFETSNFWNFTNARFMAIFYPQSSRGCQ